MTRNERQTRSDLIDPLLHKSGWNEGQIESEYMYRPGKLRLLGEQTVRDTPQFVDYILRYEPRGVILAVIEAKDESCSAGAGIQQALAYATDIAATFAFSTNGHEIVEQDLRTGAVRRLTKFPGPDELLERWQSETPLRGPTVTSWRGKIAKNPLTQPAYNFPGAPSMRYYQERAVSAAIEQMLKGHRRALLSLATGTGKTFIAFNIVYKLLSSAFVKRVLFIADRINLRDQAFNEFGALGDRRGVAAGQQVPLERDVHFAIYQSLYAPTKSGGRVFEQYPPDYFDLIIVDECHRSGYGDWGAILDHFESAFHLGMTATPKEDESANTYTFFASENSDAEGQAQPVFEYSLGQGIDDGYLATYKVLQVSTSVDSGLIINNEIERGAELIVPEGTTPREIYEMKAFERDIVVPDRTQVLCEHLAGVLRTYGSLDKTMVFCVTMEHAELVRSEMQRLLGPETGKNLYSARIVSEERDAQATLEQFQLASSTEPVVVTTVDLLSTGVNAPSVRNIVFMKPIGSVTTFKQIIGRGSRIDAMTGKTFFRIIDYTNATRLFDEWDLPSLPVIDGPLTGDNTLSGYVLDEESLEAIPNASISIRLQGRLLGETQTTHAGSFTVPELPAAVLDIFVAAKSYTRRHIRIDPTTEGARSLVIEMRRPSEGGQQIRISGVDVTIKEEIEIDLGNGNILASADYLSRAKEAIKEKIDSLGMLRNTWQQLSQREELNEYLAGQQITPELLSIVLGRTDVDAFDLFSAAAFDSPMLSLESRARAAQNRLQNLYSDLPIALITDVLDKFRLGGSTEISSSELFSLLPFSERWGGVLGIAYRLGGAENVSKFLNNVQLALFNEENDK